MTVDAAGNLYAVVENAVWAWTPSGDRLCELDMGESPTNVVFGGDGRTLFITAPSSLYSVELNTVPEPLLGDVNLDGQVNGLDVDPFVNVLLVPPCNRKYRAEHYWS